MIELLEAVNRWDTRWVLVALLFVLDIWAISLIIRARPTFKVGLLWSAIVIFCPIVGCLFWYVLGPKPVPEVMSVPDGTGQSKAPDPTAAPLVSRSPTRSADA